MIRNKLYNTRSSWTLVSKKSERDLSVNGLNELSWAMADFLHSPTVAQVQCLERVCWLLSVWLFCAEIRSINWESTRQRWASSSSWEAVSCQLLQPQHQLKWVSNMISDDCKSFEIIAFILIGAVIQAFLVLLLAPVFGRSTDHVQLFSTYLNFLFHFPIYRSTFYFN